MTVFFVREIEGPSPEYDFEFEQAETEDIVEFVESHLSEGRPFRFVPWLEDHENIELSEQEMESICSIFEKFTDGVGEDLRDLEKMYWEESIQGMM